MNNLFYIQNGYVTIGNAMVWLAKHGYTTDIREAGKYTKEEVERLIERPQDYAWPCEYIDEADKKLIVDAQKLNKNYRIKK